MKKSVSFLTLSILLLTILSSTHIQSAAELPAINIEACKKLQKAAETGNIEQARQALQEGVDINMYAEYGKLRPHHYALPITTPLTTATFFGKLDMVKFLLSQGAGVDATIDGIGKDSTPLSTLSTTIHLSQETMTMIATELLAHKANINVQNSSFKHTPLMHTVSTPRRESLARLLILAGADITLKDYKGRTALDIIQTPSMRITVENAMAEYALIQASVPPHYQVAQARESAHAGVILETPPPYARAISLPSCYAPVSALEVENLIAAALEDQPFDTIDTKAPPCATIPAPQVNEAPPAYISLICHKCAFNNPNYARQCQACNILLESGEADNDDEAKEAAIYDEAPPAYVPIICHQCTFHNPDYARQCEVCNALLEASKADDEAKEAFYAKATQAGAADGVKAPLEQPEILVLGELLRREDVQPALEIPRLGGIPLLGWIFRK